MKRREFLSRMMRYGLSAGALSALPAERLFAQQFLPALAIPIIDAHAHLPGYGPSDDEGHTFEAIRSAKLAATAIAVMGDKKDPVGADSAYAHALEGINIVRGWEAAGLVRIVRRPSDIPLQPNPAGPIPAILAIEGGDAIGTQLDRLNLFYKLGVRMITLVHGTVSQSGDNAIGRDMRHYSSPPGPSDGGLTDFGRQVVGRMNRLGMVIDVAHASTRTLFDVADCTRAPIIDSHTSPLPPEVTTRGPGRLRLYSEMAAIVETGGIVGTWPLAYDGPQFDRVTFEDWVEEIRVFKTHFGMRHIGLGTDSGGGLPGWIEGWEGIGSVGLLRDAMHAGGLGPLEVSAFMGLNFLRVFTRCHAIRQLLNYFYPA
jgi:microsomal dipeptidase-like Zn-dependent dipeptidase